MTGDELPGVGLPAPGLPEVAAVHVVVPAHDEQTHLGHCLESLQQAATALRAARPGVRVGMSVVLDRCTDASADVVAAHGVDALLVDAACVGVARRAGVARAAAATADLPPASVLVANTDADCVVPRTWLCDHVALARDHHLVQGEVSPLDLSPDVLDAWSRRNPRGRGSLHGANLSFRLDAYTAVGGYPAVATQEDLLLVRALKAAGHRSVGGTLVLTSGRRHGRVEGGFAGYLRDLDHELDVRHGRSG